MKKIQILVIIYIFSLSSICLASQSENLQKLKDLYEDNILTEDQYNEAKEKVLQQMGINNVDKTGIEGLSGGYFPDPKPGDPIGKENCKSYAPVLQLPISEENKADWLQLWTGHLKSNLLVELNEKKFTWLTEILFNIIDKNNPISQENKYFPLIDKIFPFSKVSDAHQYIQKRKNFGKVLLDFRNKNP